MRISDQCQHFRRLLTELMRQSIHWNEDENFTVSVGRMTKVHVWMSGWSFAGILHKVGILSQIAEENGWKNIRLDQQRLLRILSPLYCLKISSWRKITTPWLKLSLCSISWQVSSKNAVQAEYYIPIPLFLNILK